MTSPGLDKPAHRRHRSAAVAVPVAVPVAGLQQPTGRTAASTVVIGLLLILTIVA